MQDKEILFLTGVGFFILQFIYNVWARSQAQKIIDTNQKQTEQMIKLGQDQTREIIATIKVGVESFGQHVGRGKRTFGIVKNIQEIHEARDSDGRPMCYMPREIMEAQREITSTMHVSASTQEQIGKLMERIDSKMDSNHVEHAGILRNINTKLDIMTSVGENLAKQHRGRIE